MEFKTVKTKLNLLYSGSLLLILVIFILILYLFITHAIKNQEMEELNQFYEKEQHEFIEEIYENEDKHLDYKPEKNIFYYVFNRNNQLVDGEESTIGISEHIIKHKFYNLPTNSTKVIEWENSHLLFKNYSLNDHERNLGIVIIGIDITDEKHLIDKIIWILLVLTILFSILFAWAGNFFAGQAMKPIQKSFQTQRKFVSDASHELRTPLSIFYSSVDILSREEKNHLSTFGQEILEDIKNEAESMNHLLNDLLFLARSDQENLELDLEEVNLSLLLASLIKRFQRIVPSNITLNEKLVENVMMKGDQVRLQQLFYILLDNAMRYTKEGTITCSLATNEREIEIRIQDTGQGITSQDVPHIFDRFYRGDSSRKRDGSGLGLSIAKTIVDIHQGNIQVKSEVNSGTTFIITFPL